MAAQHAHINAVDPWYELSATIGDDADDDEDDDGSSATVAEVASLVLPRAQAKL